MYTTLWYTLVVHHPMVHSGHIPPVRYTLVIYPVGTPWVWYTSLYTLGMVHSCTPWYIPHLHTLGIPVLPPLLGTLSPPGAVRDDEALGSDPGLIRRYEANRALFLPKV